MGRIHVFTDSAADLPRSVCEAWGIQVVPMTVYLDEKEYKDGIDIDAATFYRLIAEGAQGARTAQPNPAAFVEAFAPSLEAGDEVLYVGISSGVSGTVQSARMARDLVSAPERVHVIDTLGASMGQGLMVIKAAELARQGLPVVEITRQVEGYRDGVYHVFTLNTLEFARRSGRVSSVAAMAAGLLDIKPILRIDMEGHIVSLDKTRGRKKAIKRLLDELEAKGLEIAGQRIGLSHAIAPDEAAELAALLVSQYRAGEVVMGEIGPTVGSHVGPGTIALFFSGPAGRS